MRYRDGSGLDAQVAKAHLDLRAWPLLHQQLHVLDLDVEDVDVALAPSSPSAEKNDSSFSLKPPLDLLLDHVHVGTVNITQAGQPVFASNTLDLAGSWTANGIELRQLDLRSPDGHAALGGKLAVGKNYQGDGSGRASPGRSAAPITPAALPRAATASARTWTSNWRSRWLRNCSWIFSKAAISCGRPNSTRRVSIRSR